MGPTHEVLNQPPPLADVNAWLGDPLLREHAARFGATHPEFGRTAQALGGWVGSSAALLLADQANRFSPQLRTHDRFGQPLDEVEFHPAYHALMAASCEHGLKGWSWTHARTEASVERTVLYQLWNELEQGIACPTTMSFAAVAMLAFDPELSAALAPRVCAPAYEPQLAPPARKGALTIGMAMTEKQGGSDLRANQTRAVYDPAGGTLPWRLIGHKWFCSAPMSDGFFTLARTDDGLTCFFVPRVLDDGTKNPIRVRRLKDKLGNRSNASSEIEYENTQASPIGPPGRGIPTLIGMAHLTRFDIVSAIPGMMRAGLAQALHHARHRQAFGRRLGEHALMANVLADLALEWEAALLLSLELARCFGASGAFVDYGRAGSGGGANGSRQADRARALARILTPVAKYWLCKRLPAFTAECMECLGGNGYVEDWPLARLYREAPLNGIWEGSANVICLDVLRSASRDPQAVEALGAWLKSAGEPRVDAVLRELTAALAAPDTAEVQARRVVETAALAAQAVLMRQHAPAAIAEAFVATRLGGAGLRAFGTLPADAPCAAIVERAAFGAV
jgi:putative acyl-CoA dehydrogenase